MDIFQIIIVSLVAFEHIYFMVLEMFYWDKPRGLKAFGLKLEEAKSSKVLAQNQGLYNGFLAAGLIWDLIKDRLDVQVFFLSCVVIAGIFGGITAKTSIMYTQGLPALIALLLVLVSTRNTSNEELVA